MLSTVKVNTQIGIDEKRAALRLRFMAGEMTARFGQRIRQRRGELGLTQKAVANKIGALLPEMAIDKQRVSDWERGANAPSDRYRDALVTVLEVDDISYFLLPPAPEEQPDLLDTLGSVDSEDETQLDRIEDKLDRIAKQLGDGNLIDQITQIIARATGRSQPSTDPPPSTPAAGTKPKGSRRRRAA